MSSSLLNSLHRDAFLIAFIRDAMVISGESFLWFIFSNLNFKRDWQRVAYVEQF